MERIVVPPAIDQRIPDTTTAELTPTGVLFDVAEITLPQLAADQRISMSDVRDPKEAVYLGVIWAVNAIFGVLLFALMVNSPEIISPIVFFGLAGLFLSWISSKLFQASILGHCIEASSDQYPHIHSVLKQASEFLSIPAPRMFIMQGHGMFELFVAKQFMRRGMITVTSNMLDEFAMSPTLKNTCTAGPSSRRRHSLIALAMLASSWL
ncbi:hypothetical protein [Bradyrhizobium sp. URHD0069]|uniref:hypothetical protein n=1 Tax=Bradyrhizobium sp. URHD0069 TaxID=1380355 RepID=UPI0012DD7DD9|nr:hypothetical protein [Bradyrhizobium sp. URHD0069]